MTEEGLNIVDKKLSKMTAVINKELTIIKDLFSSIDEVGLGRDMLHIEEKLYDTLSCIDNAKRDIKLTLLEICREQRKEEEDD